VIRRLLRDEGGFSLVFTLLTMLVTTVTLTTAIEYTSSNSRAANRSEADQIAYALAEAGLANGAAVLSNPDNNALDQATLPTSEPDESNPAHANYIAEYEGGTVKWWGVLTGHQWLMHGVGIVEDPTGQTEPRRREVTSTIKIMPTLKQNLNNNAWNFMMAKNTGSSTGCDVTFDNSVSVDTSLFILGNLCFNNSSAIVKAAAPDLTSLYVGGRVHFGGTGSIGTSGARINSATIVGGCKVGGTPLSGTWTTPCSASTRVYADTIANGAIVNDGGPVADFAFWYTNAKPGPTQTCSTSSNFSATTFESAGSTTRNNSAATFNLTPSSSYTCQFWDNLLSPPALLGELSWNNTTKTLTALGVVFIDGSAYISNNAVNKYNGLATLYLSGTFTISGNSQLCGGIAGGNCDFAAWDPNLNNFGIIANGSSGGYGVMLQNSARYQGSIYATNSVLLENSTQYDGPIVAGTFQLENNIATHEFPTITSVPVGWPGNPTVYAEPQPPSNYSG